MSGFHMQVSVCHVRNIARHVTRATSYGHQDFSGFSVMISSCLFLRQQNCVNLARICFSKVIIATVSKMRPAPIISLLPAGS